MSKQYAELLKANRCQHHVLNECSQEHHENCVGKKQCILDLEQIISNLKAENEKLKEKIDSCNDEFGCKELAKYCKALEEVKKYCDECNLKADFTACEVLKIIDEVLENE